MVAEPKLKCPKCGNTKEFKILVEESYFVYIDSNGKWLGNEDEHSREYVENLMKVTCAKCFEEFRSPDKFEIEY
jgi:DNA-directed RNA polymerase subunit M/transcription elongation factor TFIIS